MHASDKGSIALVDDEENLRETVGFALRREGYRVEEYADGASAWETLSRTPTDVVILDIMMPRMDGLELCRRLRAESEELPIIFLTSRDEELDRVLGLELGADDYLCKPFSMRELQARIKVLFRRLHLAKRGRQADSDEEILAVGDLHLDLRRYTALWQGQPVQLTVTEFLILQALARHPGHVKTREQLMQEGYPHDTYVSDRTIDSHIKRLRKKMIKNDPGFDGIETVYGLGYRYRQPGPSA
ncbi:MAG: response regulator transcription factor [Holophagales bacterium]|nr:response regulator transcription factor [Holophagales bacterium]